MILPIKTPYVDDEVELRFLRGEDGAVAIYGTDPETREPIFRATVDLPQKPAPGCVWLKGWSENEGIPEALAEAGLVRLTGRMARTGFVMAEEAQLTEAALREVVT